MKTYTINEQNTIVAFATQEEAAAGSATPFDTFTSAEELAQLAAAWPAERLLAIWNGVDGLTPATEIKDPAKAAKLLFKRLEKAEAPAREKPPKANKKAIAGAQAAKGAPAKRKTSKKATAAKNAASAKPAPKTKKAAKAEASAPREGSKMAQAVALMQRKNGVTLQELMDTLGWQAHSCRGFVAGSLKKAGYKIDSFKNAQGERSYKING